MNILLVIDMQNAWLANPARPCHDRAGVFGRINHAAAAIRAQGGKVIFVQHADTDAVVGSSAWDIIAALTVASDDIKVHKRACDSFADTSLAHELEGLGRDTLYICGFATEFCVDTTVRAAASRAMNIVVLADAHTSSDRPHLGAETIINHHNWIWENMAVPEGGSLQVRPTAQIFPV